MRSLTAPQLLRNPFGARPGERPPRRPTTGPGPRQLDRTQLLVVALCATVIVATTAWFAFALPATPGRLTKQGAGLIGDQAGWRFVAEHAFVPGSPWALAVWIVAMVTATFVAYAVILVVLWRARSRMATWIVVTAAVLALVCSVLALPNQTSDVYDYALFARVATVQNQDPYERFPDAYPDDPLYPYSSHQYTGTRDNKLPVWTDFSIAVSAVAGDGPVANLLAYRLALAGALAASAGLISMILRRIRPNARLHGLAVFALNPVVLALGPSKTDALMVLLAVAGMALVATRRTKLATIALTLASLVKLIALPLLAVHLLLLVSTKRWRAIPQLGIAALVTALVYAPTTGKASLALDQVGLLGASGSVLPDVVRPLAALAFVGVVAWAGLTPGRWHPSGPRPAGDLLARRWVPVALWFAVLLTRLSLPWYLIVPVAVVAIGGRRLSTAVLVVAMWASFLYGTWFATSTAVYPLPSLVPGHRVLAQLVPALLTALVVSLAVWRHWRAVPHPSPPQP